MMATAQEDLVHLSHRHSCLCYRQYLVLWLLFFLICFGLGYPTLYRVDLLHNLFDTRAYYELVTGASSPQSAEYSQRVLVPYLARPFYWVARGHLGTWDPVFFGLLVSNSLFVSTAACLLVNIGYVVTGDRAIALLGAMLYLLNFAAGNYQLSGMVDSSQVFVIVGVIRTLLTEKWRWLALWGLIGAFTKETTVPICVAFAGGWWLVARDWRKAFWILAMAAIGLAALSILMTHVSIYTPLSFARSQRAADASVLGCFVNHEFVYVFIWLLPLGLISVRDFPRPWAVASLAGEIAVVAMGAYSGANANTVRPMFNVAGPLLSLSAALTIYRFMGHREDRAF